MIYTLQKKWGYPSVLKTARIAPEGAGIGSKFLSRRFFSWRFKPPQFECRYRVAGPVSELFKSVGRGIQVFQIIMIQDLYQRFQKAYTSAFESVGIGKTYSSVLKSPDIALELIKFKQTYISTFESAGIGLKSI